MRNIIEKKVFLIYKKMFIRRFINVCSNMQNKGMTSCNLFQKRLKSKITYYNFGISNLLPFFDQQTSKIIVERRNNDVRHDLKINESLESTEKSLIRLIESLYKYNHGQCTDYMKTFLFKLYINQVVSVIKKYGFINWRNNCIKINFNVCNTLFYNCKTFEGYLLLIKGTSNYSKSTIQQIDRIIKNSKLTESEQRFKFNHCLFFSRIDKSKMDYW